jgi:F-type H+-transporting ATPase subunit gamma
METLEHLRRRVATAEDLQSIVKTMQVLAAAGIRQYERAAASLVDYDRTVRLGLQALLRTVPMPRGVSRGVVGGEEDEEGTVLGVVFGSDQGLCGQLNERVVERAQGLLRRADAASVVVASGLRLASLLEPRGTVPVDRFSTPGSIEGVADATRQVLLAIEHHRQRLDAAASVYLVFPRRTAAASYSVHLRRVLPLDQRWIAALRARPWPTRCIASWPGEGRVVLARLVREYLFVSLFRAQVDALASEHASRLSSMQAAERNIEERLTRLRGEHRQRRQMAITSNLMDVIAGFEALTAPSDR